MKKKPTLSPSKISTYLACTSKYRWTYLDERGRFYLRARSYYSFGTSLHRVLQRFHDSGDTGVQTTAQALAALDESWISAGYSSAQEMQEALGEGRNIVEQYLERHQLEPTTAQTLFVEKQLRLDLGDFVLIGRVDRVDRRNDGTIEVVDYKSGRSDVTIEDVATDLAMNCYQLLLSAAFPGEPVCATILALRTNTRATHSMTTEELEEFRRDIIFLGNEILSRDFTEITPKWIDLCPDCEFIDLCRLHPEYSDSVPT